MIEDDHRPTTEPTRDRAQYSIGDWPREKFKAAEDEAEAETCVHGLWAADGGRRIEARERPLFEGTAVRVNG
jgi:hypothetical protein